MDALSGSGELRGSWTSLVAALLVLSTSFSASLMPILSMTQDASEPSVVYEWSSASSMILPRASPVALILTSGDILVIGGISTNGPTATTEIFDSEALVWKPGPTMNSARVGHTATLLDDGTVLVTGGESGKGTVASAEIIDVVRGGALSVGSMYFARSGHAASSLPDGRVLISGGTDWISGTWYQAEAYNPSTHSFEPAGSMQHARMLFTMHLLASGDVLAVGGDIAGTSEMFDPSTGVWVDAVSMGCGRYEFAAAELEDGRIVVAGGMDDGVVMSSAEIYDPTSNSWTSAGDMTQPRMRFSLTGLSDGKLIAAGSSSSEGSTDTTEIFCMKNMEWTASADMIKDRGAHGAVMMTDGSVCVMGGKSGEVPLSSVEILVETQVEPPVTGPCQPIDLVPLVLSVASELRGHSENGLIAKLIVAQYALDAGDVVLCLEAMEDFYNQLHGLFMSSHLSYDGITLLYTGYASVVECLGGTPLPEIP